MGTLLFVVQAVSDARQGLSTSGTTRWLTPGLLLATVGVYALLITGAVSSLADTAAACSTWPTCNGSWIASLDDRTQLVAIGHRAATALVFALLIGVTALAWLTETPRWVRGPLVGALLLFPLQIGIGALTATGTVPTAVSALHLVLAMAIFAAVLLAMLQWLEWSTAGIEASFDRDTTQDRSVDTGKEPSNHPLGAYLAMTKPRLMWLLVIVALAGIGLAGASGAAIHLSTVVGAVVGGVLAIGASGTFNHILERDIDRQMARTADRPLVQSTVPLPNAVAFGTGLAVASIATFLWLTNPLAAGLGLVAIAFYSVGYTLILKPNTRQNIVIGGAVGAFPAIIGWAAVTGSIGVPALVLGLVIFLWTPAHFYNLALVYQRDYARGGFPMLPIVAGDRTTQRHIVMYAGATLISVGLLGAIGGLGWLYGATAILAGGGFLLAIVALFRHRTAAAAMRTFHASNGFLGVLMLVIIVETLLVG